MIADLSNLNIGVEEEYQLVDPTTGELTSFVSEILNQGATLFRDDVKPELLQSQIEIGSKVCDTVGDLSVDLKRLRSMVKSYANK